MASERASSKKRPHSGSPSVSQDEVLLWTGSRAGSGSGLGPGMCRWLESVSAVVAVELPVVVVNQVVAAFTQQGEVVNVGGAAAGEPFDVVGFGSFDGRAAVDAAAITSCQHDPLAGTGVSLSPSQPKWVTLGVEDGGKDLGSRGEAGDLIDRYGQAVVVAQVRCF